MNPKKNINHKFPKSKKHFSFQNPKDPPERSQERSTQVPLARKNFSRSNFNQPSFDPSKTQEVFDLILERRLGADKLKALAQESQELIEKMLNAELLAADFIETHIEKAFSKHSVGGLQPKFQPSHSYRPKNTTITENLSQKKSTPQNNDQDLPTRGFAKAKIRLSQLNSQELTNNKELTYKSTNINSNITTSESQFTTPAGLKLDPWQYEALQSLLNSRHVIIDAPTSAGKTRVIEALLEYRMKEGAKLIYTSPVKSLSNDKYREFSEKYGRENVGINTGDFKENLGAPIILSTLETYRNSLLGIEPNMSRRIVVYDEYHYLQDESRGSAWEESLILTPKGSQLILLSASVPNAEDFADWIKDLTGIQADVIRVKKRPVPLVHLIHTKYGWILGDLLSLSHDDLAELKRAVQKIRKESRRHKGKSAYKEFLDPMSSALNQNLGPIVVYAGRRGDVEGIANSFAKFLKIPMNEKESKKLSDRVKNLSGWEYLPSELQKLVLKHGIAFHHSGMIPPGRVAIESLLKEGLLRICCGTMGISLGVNFAVRSAFIFDESRPSEGGESRYSNTEVMQMLGRAGRRGHDTQGFSLWLHAGRYADFKPKDREPCRSSLKFDPTTVIGLLGHHKSLAYLSEFYHKSFFMRGKNSKSVLVSEHDLNRIVSHLQRVGALEGSIPTLTGQIARHFPQAGGLIIANWFAKGLITKETFPDYLQAMAAFGAAHFKEIPLTYADVDFLQNLNLPERIAKYYPSELFPELYDDLKPKRGAPWEETRVEKIVFREFNLGAASIVHQWINPKTTWESLVEEHSSKYFSDGDCMNVLFRFATFLQSCARLSDIDPAVAAEAKRLWHVLLREPLDARNRMLVEEADEFENIPDSEQEEDTPLLTTKS